MAFGQGPGASFDSVVQRIERRTGYRIYFDPKQVSSLPVVDVPENASIQEAMTMLLKVVRLCLP
jgi:hypothetical protein